MSSLLLLFWGCASTPPPQVAPKAVVQEPASETQTVLSEEELLERLRRLLDEGEVTKALHLAQKALDERPELDGLRINSSVWLWGVGKRRAATLLLDSRPTSMLPEPEVTRLATLMHFELAKDGPNISHTRTQITASPSKDPEADKRWIAEHFSLCEKNGALFLQLATGSDQEEAALSLLVSVFLKQEKWGEILLMLEAHPKFVQANPKLLAMKGRAHLMTGAPEQAAALARSGLQHRPRDLALLQLLEEAATALGETAEAQRAGELRGFYGFLVPGGELEFTSERAKIVGQLRAFFHSETSSPDARKEEAKEVARLLEELAGSPNQASAEMLGAFVFHHSHDEREARAFDALDELGEIAHPVLLRMLRNGMSTCTIRSSAEILGQHQVRAALPDMLRLLPQDHRFAHPMFMPQALARMGAPEAVPELSQFLLGAPPNDFDSMSEIALTFTRQQAALALGVLGGREAKVALLKATSLPEMRKAARGGLCLHRLKELEDEPAWEVGGPRECGDFVQMLSGEDMGTINVGGQTLAALEILGGEGAREWRPELEKLKPNP